jgi:DNA-binding transcriptional regulator YdaS (Cro superfamily)
MKLDEHLTKTKTTEAAFAKRIGVTPSVVNRYRRGLMRPGWQVMAAIARETNGLVLPNDFADFLLEPNREVAK